MRPRTELILAVTVAGVLGVGAAALGARHARIGDVDRRRSTFLAGPSGALGYTEALQRLGVEVERLRRPPDELRRSLADSVPTIVAILGATEPVTVREASVLVGMSADILVAGRGAQLFFDCVGYERMPLTPDSVAGPMVLVRRLDRTVADSAVGEDGVVTTCSSPPPITVDTLRAVPEGPVALRLTYENGRAIVLVAHDSLFGNRALRDTDAGPFVIGLVVPRYQRVIVDEFHHGFAVSGSLAGALLDWSVRSPWGWAAWQMAIVGLLAFLASGVRFGPVRSVIDRRRRSPLEHVRALATALAAARGHTVAVKLMVRGLRRRLSATGEAGAVGRADTQAWLGGLAGAVETPEGRRALATLEDLTGRPVDAEGVRQAANAVEDVWEELTTKSLGTPRPPQLS